MKLTKKIVRNADAIIKLDSTDDLPIDNIGGRIAATMLEHNGYYTCIWAGKLTLFILNGVRHYIDDMQL